MLICSRAFKLSIYLILALFTSASGCKKQDNTAASGAEAGDNSSPAIVEIPEVFPPLPTPRMIGNEIEFYEIQIAGNGPGRPMKLNLYLPTGRHDPKSLPCVFIAPAGSGNHGSIIDDSDRAEHYPYVRAGFAVMAYELSGPVANPRATTMTWREAIPAIEEFMRSDGGLINGKIAIDYALKKVPEVDPNQLFACGHSSSAVVSLNLARGDSRIRACCAYAPSTDVEAWWKPARVENHVPGFTAFAERKSPRRHVEDFSCPVFLFHADDDSMVALSDNQRFANAMKDAGKRITFERVKSGDHYDSMIEHGIPDGIAFMQSNGAKPLPPVTHGPK